MSWHELLLWFWFSPINESNAGKRNKEVTLNLINYSDRQTLLQMGHSLYFVQLMKIHFENVVKMLKSLEYKDFEYQFPVLAFMQKKLTLPLLQLQTSKESVVFYVLNK